MMSVWDVLHDGLESIVVIGLVVYDALATVSFLHGVLSLDDITVAHLPVGLVVTGVVILNTIFELVLGVSVGFLLLMVYLLVVTMNFLVVLGRDCDGQTGEKGNDLE